MKKRNPTEKMKKKIFWFFDMGDRRSGLHKRRGTVVHLVREGEEGQSRTTGKEKLNNEGTNKRKYHFCEFTQQKGRYWELNGEEGH